MVASGRSLSAPTSVRYRQMQKFGACCFILQHARLRIWEKEVQRSAFRMKMRKLRKGCYRLSLFQFRKSAWQYHLHSCLSTSLVQDASYQSKRHRYECVTAYHFSSLLQNIQYTQGHLHIQTCCDFCCKEE